MKLSRSVRALIIIFLVTINISCDQVSKSIVRSKVDTYERIPLIENHLTLTKVENSGAFLGMGSELPPTVKTIFLTIFPAIIILVLLVGVFIRSKINREALIGLSFIIGGGIGNMFDRIVHGTVTDFLHIDFVLFQTGIFNMADVSVMVGTAIIFIYSFREKKLSASES